MALSTVSFRFIQEFARDTAAIVLDPGKEYLVEARLEPIARQAGFSTLDDFITQLRMDRKATLFHEQVIDAITTNETSFFRDFHPFEALRQYILPKVIEQRAAAKKLNIWSAASSTGQEPYTIAMVIREHFPQLNDWNINILATDLSPTVLNQAKTGVYSQLEINRGLPASMLLKYFEKADAKWAIKPTVKSLVEFRLMNLVKPWPILPAFDIVFIRNVMIYFDVETKRTILKRIRQCLHPKGFLFLGTAETTINLDPEWLPISFGKATAHQFKNGSPSAA